MSPSKIALMTGAVVLSMATTASHAENNPFEVKALSQGYQVADAADSKAKEGKCGSGRCGAHKKKMKEGSCSAEKMKEGACSAEKMKEGSCSAEKMKEGACHASK